MKYHLIVFRVNTLNDKRLLTLFYRPIIRKLSTFNGLRK